jgi:hypothetical protein
VSAGSWLPAVAEALVGLLLRCYLPTIRYRDAGRPTEYDRTCLTARCAGATNPVAPGTASVIPPRMGACLLVLNEKVSGSLLFNSTLEGVVRTAAGTR